MGFIVHRIQNHAFCCFGGFAIDAWGGGHIQPFCAFDVAGIVYADKGGFVIAVKRCTGGAVRLITNNQVKFRQPVLCLRLMNDIDGVVGGVDNGHCRAAVVAFVHGNGVGKAFGVGGGGKLQIAGAHKHAVVVCFAVFADIAVGTDGEVNQRDFAVLRPFAQRLTQQGKAGYEKQHAPPFARQVFGNPQRSKGFTRAARHNQPAARFARCKAVSYPFQGFPLVFSQRFFGFEYNGGINIKLRPVYQAVFQIVQRDFGNGRLLVGQRVFGVFRPFVGGSDNQAVAEMGFA